MPTMALALLALSPAAHAAGPPGRLFTRVFGPADGVVGGQIRALALDDAGSLIVGTEGGVCRFDGQGCARLLAPPGFENSFVTELLWHDGALYVATRGGVYRVRQGRATVLFEQPSAGVTTGFAVDDEGSVWIALESGLWRVHGEVTTHLVDAPELGMRAVAIDARGVLVGAATGVYRWDGAALRASPSPRVPWARCGWRRRTAWALATPKAPIGWRCRACSPRSCSALWWLRWASSRPSASSSWALTPR